MFVSLTPTLLPPYPANAKVCVSLGVFKLSGLRRCRLTPNRGTQVKGPSCGLLGLLLEPNSLAEEGSGGPTRPQETPRRPQEAPEDPGGWRRSAEHGAPIETFDALATRPQLKKAQARHPNVWRGRRPIARRGWSCSSSSTLCGRPGRHSL